MRSLYLSFLYNSDRHVDQRVHQVKFIDDGIEVTYADNARKQFTFASPGNVNGDELSKKLDTILEVS
jgi:O-phosphoseryl-tRNA(Cys) synthetase